MFIKKEEIGLCLLDVQEKLFPHIDRGYEILEKICYILQAAKILKIPVFVTEQVPDKLGETIQAIKERLPEGQILYPKTAFSAVHDPLIRVAMEKSGIKTWILVGIEA